LVLTLHLGAPVAAVVLPLPSGGVGDQFRPGPWYIAPEVCAKPEVFSQGAVVAGDLVVTQPPEQPLVSTGIVVPGVKSFPSVVFCASDLYYCAGQATDLLRVPTTVRLEILGKTFPFARPLDEHVRSADGFVCIRRWKVPRDLGASEAAQNPGSTLTFVAAASTLERRRGARIGTRSTSYSFTVPSSSQDNQANSATTGSAGDAGFAGVAGSGVATWNDLLKSILTMSR
jgi:hypothetical protein